MKIYKHKKQIRYEDAASVFGRVRGDFGCAFLLESRSVSHIYGRMSLIGVDPVLEIVGKNDQFEVKTLNERAKDYLAVLGEMGEFENITEGVRYVLQRFKQDEKELIGLYGAFSYDYVRQFEDLPSLLSDEGVPDFRLFLYDKFIFFDHLKEKAEIVTYGLREGIEVNLEVSDICEREQFYITDAEFEMDENKYMELVKDAKNLARRGELFEVVYCNTLKAKFRGDPFALYQVYKEINPSPYLFFFDFGNEQLVGASPEMMVRCENGIVNLRPISGTAKRGADPLEDHENMLELLSSEKERAELDMLIDLGRNDLARICKPGIKITDYRFIEKYSKVMHTVAHVSGELREEFTALDALIACLNAGTLTGAPKVAAMIAIEKAESSRRGYYGGTIGYLTFNGDMDTGIIIRTAHIKDGQLSLKVGATLLYDSDPISEYRETINKASAFLTTFRA